MLAKLAAAFENIPLNVPAVPGGAVPSAERPWFEGSFPSQGKESAVAEEEHSILNPLQTTAFNYPNNCIRM